MGASLLIHNLLFPCLDNLFVTCEIIYLLFVRTNNSNVYLGTKHTNLIETDIHPVSEALITLKLISFCFNNI